MAEQCTLPTGELLFAYINVFSSQCPHCKKECIGSKHFFAVGAPYYCLLHHECAPHFQFNNQWPHPYPASVYLNAQFQQHPLTQIKHVQDTITSSSHNESSSTPVHNSGSDKYCGNCRAKWN